MQDDTVARRLARENMRVTKRFLYPDPVSKAANLLTSLVGPIIWYLAFQRYFEP